MNYKTVCKAMLQKTAGMDEYPNLPIEPLTTYVARRATQYIRDMQDGKNPTLNKFQDWMDNNSVYPDDARRNRQVYRSTGGVLPTNNFATLPQGSSFGHNIHAWLQDRINSSNNTLNPAAWRRYYDNARQNTWLENTRNAFK